MESILGKAKEGDVVAEPFPYLSIKNAIDDSFCLRLIEEYPSLVTTSGQTDVGSNIRFSLPAHRALEDEAIPPIWKEFIGSHCSQEFLDQMIQVFGNHILTEYPSFEDDFGRLDSLRAGIRRMNTFEDADVLLDMQISVNTPVLRPSSVRGGHLDNPNKLIFGLFYLRHPDDTSKGGELEIYKHKDNFKYDHGKDIEPKYLDLVDTLAYERNHLVLLLNSPTAVHGVSPRSSTDVPRLFVNIVTEVKKPLFKIHHENRVSAFFKRANIMKSYDPRKANHSPHELGFTDNQKESILLLNPGSIEHVFPLVGKEYNILYLNDLKDLSDNEKRKIVAAISGKGKEKITKEVLNTLPSLKIHSITSGSLRKFYPEIFIEREIPLLGVGKVYAEAVAEFALMDILIGVRRASLSFETMRRGGWGVLKETSYDNLRNLTVKISTKLFGKSLVTHLIAGFFNGGASLWERKIGASWNKRLKRLIGKFNYNKEEYNASPYTLTGSTVGIIGFGPVSERLIKLLRPFNCRISIYSEFLSEEKARSMGVNKGSLDEVCKSNVVTVHRGLSDRTRGSFGKKQIEMLRLGSVFVNVSRGAIIDQKALLNRLKKGDIFACLDVYDKEPLSSRHPLRKLPNVFITSHIANSTDSIYQKAITDLANRTIAYLKGDSSVGIVTTSEHLKNMT